MSWYKEGSINIEQGSNTVIGINTKWANPLIGVCAGQMLILKTANAIEICEIASVQSDTQLTLANQYSGATKTGVSYEVPTVPKVSIEALALRISEMLNYYQLQMNGWQSILTGTGDITLTAPDGRVVTIKSQKALTEAINVLNDQVYIVESYRNGSNWYNVYSNGFIEQSGAIKVNIPKLNTICGVAINLLKPMKTQNYGVTIDKVSSAGPWVQAEFSYAELYANSFYLAAHSSIAGDVWIRWTVRGY